MSWSVIVQDIEPGKLKATLDEVIADEKFAAVEGAHLEFAVDQALTIVGEWPEIRGDGDVEPGPERVSVGMWPDGETSVHVEVTLKKTVALPG
jgi:hypothetical protein